MDAQAIQERLRRRLLVHALVQGDYSQMRCGTRGESLSLDQYLAGVENMSDPGYRRGRPALRHRKTDDVVPGSSQQTLLECRHTPCKRRAEVESTDQPGVTDVPGYDAQRGGCRQFPRKIQPCRARRAIRGA